MTNTNDIRVALTNLGKYNEGELTYVWLTLPATSDEIQTALDEIGINEEYEEYFISDYEAPFQIGEYESLTRLNEVADELDELDDYETVAFNAYIDGCSEDVNEALEVAQSGDYVVWDDVENMEDIAYAMVDEGYFEIDESNILSRYINYEALGRDIGFDGTFIFIDGKNCVEFHA